MTYSTKRPYRVWTAEQVALLARDWPTLSRTELETRYGRDGETLRATLRRWGYDTCRNLAVQHANSGHAARRRWAVRRNFAAGTTTTVSAVAAAKIFGIDPSTMTNWIKRKWIAARRARIGKDVLYAIEPKAIESFLRTRGGTIDLLVATPYRIVYEDAKVQLRGRLVHSAELQRLMMTSVDLAYFRRQHKMPMPALRNGSKNGGDWYERSEIRGWLDAHPHYHTTQTRGAL